MSCVGCQSEYWHSLVKSGRVIRQFAEGIQDENEREQCLVATLVDDITVSFVLSNFGPRNKSTCPQCEEIARRRGEFFVVIILF